jgi:hypothetical protein
MKHARTAGSTPIPTVVPAPNVGPLVVANERVHVERAWRGGTPEPSRKRVRCSMMDLFGRSWSVSPTLELAPCLRRHDSTYIAPRSGVTFLKTKREAD